LTHALGRVLEHDERSRGFPAKTTAVQRTVLWSHTAPVLDQGELGSCTGNALAQCLNTTHFKASRKRYLDEAAAKALYSKATTLDDVPGAYPPQDTGSSGLAVCKAGVQLGYLSGYQHAFGFDHFIGALQLSPVIVGTNWYQGMYDVDSMGFITPGGDIAGGHEYLILGVNITGQYVTMLNSWSKGWGRNGRARIRFNDFQRLLNEDGDVTIPLGK
jgi:hypothetical protein